MESYIVFALIALGAVLAMFPKSIILNTIFGFLGVSLAVGTFSNDSIVFHPWLSVMLFFVCITCVIRAYIHRDT